MNKDRRKIKYLIVLQIVLVVIAVFFMGFMIQKVLQIERENTSYEEIQKKYAPVVQAKDKKQERKINFDELRRINFDTVGWIYIDGTPINYPVVKGKNNIEYLTKSFENDWSISGSIFADYRITNESQNIIIYGHNMGKRKEEMFSKLLNYKKIDWANKHAVIDFQTTEIKNKWRVFSTFEMPVNEAESILKTTFKGNEEYLLFLEMLEKKSINKMGVQTKVDKKMLMLVTCENGNQDKRFVVCALKN